MARGKRKQAKVAEEKVEKIEKVEEQIIEAPKEEKREEVKKEEVKDEVVKEDKKVIEKVTKAKEPAKKEVKKEAPPKNLNEYVQKQLEAQEARRAAAQKTKVVHVDDGKGNIKVVTQGMPERKIKKGKLLRNTVVSNSITGWQRTLLKGMEVEIVSDYGNRITIRAYGMLHTIAAQYIQKI